MAQLVPANLTRLVKPVLATVVVAFGTTVAACGGTGGDDGIAGKTIRYQVEYYGSPQTGTAHRAVTISYATDDGRQEQHDVGLPWDTAVGPASSRFTPSVKAQFYGFGTIICRILADDNVIQEKTSMEEPYPTVECQS